MSKITTIPAAVTLLLLLAPLVDAQSLLARAQRLGVYHGLIEDNTAAHVGDILTIVIREEHKITQEDKTKRSTTNSFSAALQSFDIKPSTFTSGILPDLDITSDREYEGQAKQDRNQTFEARVAVTVRDVLPNGNLIIVGTRTIRIDDEDKTLKISGIIRKLDITPLNTIRSDQVAEAKIAIEGTGKNTEATTKGPVARIIETAWWLVWPF